MTPFTQGTSTRSGSVDTDPQASARVLLAQQVALHGSNVPWAAAGALLLALLFVTLQWSVIAHGVLLGWLGALLAVMAWRGGMGLRQRGARGARLADSTWLLLYRLNFLAHGLVWAAASGLPMDSPDAMHLALLVMMLAGICASNFILNAFDLTGALLFGVPTMVALTLLVGLLQTGLAVARLGTLANFISPSVMLGFTTGAAALIAWYALAGLMGAAGRASPLQAWQQGVAPAALAVGGVTLVAALAGRRWWRRGGSKAIWEAFIICSTRENMCRVFPMPTAEPNQARHAKLESSLRTFSVSGA